MRFISPDGRPLGQLLDANGDRLDADPGRAKRGSQRGRKGAGSKAEQRWERAMQQGGSGAAGGQPRDSSEAETLELEVCDHLRRNSSLHHGNANAHVHWTMVVQPTLACRCTALMATVAS